MKKQILMLAFTAISGAAIAQGGSGGGNTNPVTVGRQQGINVKLAAIKADPVLRMPEAKKNYHITGYEVSYLPKGGGHDVLGPYIIKGDKITGNPIAAKALDKVQPGDKIYFTDIVAVSDDGGQPLALAAAVSVQ